MMSGPATDWGQCDSANNCPSKSVDSLHALPLPCKLFLADGPGPWDESVAGWKASPHLPARGVFQRDSVVDRCWRKWTAGWDVSAADANAIATGASQTTHWFCYLSVWVGDLFSILGLADLAATKRMEQEPVGLALIGDSLYLRLPYASWIYAGLAVAFLAFHNLHAWITYTRESFNAESRSTYSRA
jgi:hypothetical protein